MAKRCLPLGTNSSHLQRSDRSGSTATSGQIAKERYVLHVIVGNVSISPTPNGFLNAAIHAA
jgi:hypothetical protein